MGEIAFVDLALDDGLAGNFPVVYTVTRDDDRPSEATARGGEQAIATGSDARQSRYKDPGSRKKSQECRS